jgi:hypothetical protein
VRRTGKRAFIFGIALILQASLSRAAVIQVTTQRASGSGNLAVGQGVTVNVLGRVNQPISGGDGIFTFDLDLVIANLIAGQPPVLQVQSVTRPGTNDALFGGSNGQATPAGLHAIYGGYLDTTRGVDSPALLFSVDFLAVVPGTTTVTPGPAVDPYGFDFVLYQSSAPTVLYGPGLSLTVDVGANQVPLPTGVASGFIVGLGVIVGQYGRRHRRRASTTHI